jgi:hypothetical protein
MLVKTSIGKKTTTPQRVSERVFDPDPHTNRCAACAPHFVED